MADKCYYSDATEAEFFKGNSVSKKKLCTMRGFQKPLQLLSATEITDHSISDKTGQTVSSHFGFTAQSATILLLHLLQETVFNTFSLGD